MKFKYTLFFLFFLSVRLIAQDTILYYEKFDLDEKPIDWSYDYEVGSIDWHFQSGGYSISGNPGDGQPPFPKQGDNNAVFYYVSPSGETTKLISPSYNIAFAVKPELRFWHAQPKKITSGNNDDLKVYYRNSTEGSWVLLKYYTSEIPEWIEQTIQLPDSSFSSDYYIAFEGITNNGFGTCVDSMIIIETGIISKAIESVTIKQASTYDIPTSSTLNKILRVDFKIIGNDGEIVMDSIAFKSLNTNDENIVSGGVKIYYSEDTLFMNSSQLKTGSNFSSGNISFSDLNLTLETGLSSIWLLYDIKEDIDHNMQDNILDAYIPENGMKINGYYYPVIDKSPDGERIIVESIFFDDFETDKSWVFTPEFERNIPLGAGGTQNLGQHVGKPDPTIAVSGENIIGTDLGYTINDGDYADNLTHRETQAVMPTVNAKYYKNTRLYFQRWLNVQVSDTVAIDISTDNGSTWINFWENPKQFTENNWHYIQYDIGDYADRINELKVRFALGGTDDSYVLSGWNIDDFFLTGDFISKDVGITEWIAPLGGCGYSDEEYVKVRIQNYAGEDLTVPLPLSFSFDGGINIIYDTIPLPNIAIDGFIEYEITKPIDLSAPGWYNNVYATTNLPGDEDNTNNRIDTSVFISPTYSLPYSEDFESNYGYYKIGGINTTWEYGTPSEFNPIIDTAASGINAWVTNLDGTYLNNDSSFLESPCFDFTGTDSIIFEFKCIGTSEDKVDGLTLQYSFDNGDTWDFVPNDHDYYWEWYNETSISELGTAGIDNTSSSWLTMRQLLPDNFSSESNVKFRFLFESSPTTTQEGFGIDDIKIYKAPNDAGISSIDAPATACTIGADTEVEVYVENYGPNIIETGTKIPLTLKFDSEIINDTLTVAGPFNPGSNTLFTFGTTVDMSYAADFDFTVYTKIEQDTYFYNETVSNDTIYDTISVTGMPNYNPFNDQLGDIAPIDTFLVAGEGFDTYTWCDGDSIPNDLAPNDTLFVQYPGWYDVTVTNIAGCSAKDSVEVVSSIINMEMDTLFTIAADSCERNELTELVVQITHNSLSDLTLNDTIWMGYQVNENAVIEDTLVLTEDFVKGTTKMFTYSEKCDLTSPGVYNVKVFTNVLKDLDHADDSTSKTFNTNGYVEIDMNYDTVYSSSADTLDLITTPGYSNYVWNVAGTTNTIKPTDNQSKWYKVTVTDVFACLDDKDSVYVETYDFGIDSVVNPISDCGHTTTEAIQVSIHNYSGNTYLTDTKIPFRFNFNGAGWENDTATLVSDITPGEDRTLTLTKTVNANSDASYTFDIELNSGQDANLLNDSFNGDFETYGYPVVSLPYDTIFTTRADTVELVAQFGFKTYDWSDGSSGSNTLSVSDNFSKKYKVTVTDMNDCITSVDSTHIITYNVGINTLVSPASACENTGSEDVIITIKNYSQDIMYTDTVIPVGYILEGEDPVIENFTLEADLGPSQAVNYTFADQVDVSSLKTHRFKLFTAFNLDVKTSNDTLVDAIKTFGYPSTEIGTDIYTTQPDTVKLVAEQGFYGYYWNTGIQNDTLIVTYPATKLYRITVSDINGCTTSDELTVYTYNITTDSLINPFPYESCDALSSEPVRIEYINNSKDTLLAGESLSFSYSINSGSLKSGSYILTEPLYPDSVGEFEFTQKANLLESITYEFTIISRKTTNDADTDDALIKDVNINAPIVSLGSDIVYFTGSTELSTTEIYESYLWSTGETSSSIIVTESGEYSVEVENFDGCTGTASIEAFNTTGIDNVVQGEDYKITYFPNPATEKLNLVFENKKNTDILIEIININGQVMYNNKLSNVLDEVKQIDVNPFTSGVYFIRFRINDEYYLKKLIIQ